MVATIATNVTAADNPNEESPASCRVEDKIRDDMRQRIAQLENANLHDLTYRLVELDQEWDVDRVLEFGLSGITLGGIALSQISSRKWLLFSCLAAGFLMQQVTAGWCPPFLVLRQLGFRKAGEINRERMALKVIRGDFADLGVLPMHGGLASNNSLLDAVEE